MCAVSLSERLAALDALCDERTARDLEVIRKQLARAEAKLLRGQPDVRWELQIIERCIDRAERRLRAA